MDNRVKLALFAVAAIVIGGITASFDLPPLSASSPPNLKAIEFRDLSGQPVQLSDYEGKVVVLNFWATWCPPCTMELPHFKEAFEAYQDKNVVILGASLDAMSPYNMPPEDIEAFASENGLAYPIVLADRVALENVAQLQDLKTVFQGMEDSSVREDGSVTAIPTTFFVSPDGTVDHKYVGYMPKAYLVRQLDQLLGES
jgi:peroxiredoxin